MLRHGRDGRRRRRRRCSRLSQAVHAHALSSTERVKYATTRRRVTSARKLSESEYQKYPNAAAGFTRQRAL